MSKLVQVWKDEDFRLSLTAEERAMLPENPAGLVELTDAALDELVAGGGGLEVGSCCWSTCGGSLEEPV